MQGEPFNAEIAANQIGTLAMSGSDGLCRLTIGTFCEMPALVGLGAAMGEMVGG